MQPFTYGSSYNNYEDSDPINLLFIPDENKCWIGNDIQVLCCFLRIDECIELEIVM